MIYKAPTSIKNQGALRGVLIKSQGRLTENNVFLDADEMQGVMENYRYEQAINSRFLVLRFEMHASQIHGCIMEQRVEKKRKIAVSVWVHNAFQQLNIGGRCWCTFCVMCMSPTYALICVTAELLAKHKIVKRVPKGTSEYQAAWIIDSEEEVWFVSS